MASVAEAVAEYDAWCEARGGSCDFAEEAESVDRLRRALDVAFENAEHASSPLDALLDTARALLDDDPRNVSHAFPDETHEETLEVASKRARRALEAVGDHFVAGSVRVADLAGSPEAEAVACAALRAFANAAESPRDAFVAVLERLHIRAEQLRRGARVDDDGDSDDDDDASRGASAARETESSSGWRLAAECLRAMTSLLARWRRDPALHVLDAEPLVRHVEAIAVASLSLTELEGLPDISFPNETHATTSPTSEPTSATLGNATNAFFSSKWASPAEALDAARAYRLGVLRLFARDSCLGRETKRASESESSHSSKSLNAMIRSRNDENERQDVSGVHVFSQNVDARVARLCLAWLARDPRPLTLRLVSAATRERGVADVASTFRVSGLEDHVDEFSTTSSSSSVTCSETTAPVVGAVVLAGAWLVAAEERCPFPEPFEKTETSPCRSAEAFFSARPERVAAAVAAAFAFADGDKSLDTLDTDVCRSALNAAAVRFAAVAFRRCGEGGAPSRRDETDASYRESENRRRETFAAALASLETRVVSAPSLAFRELARVAHARLLTAVDHETRFALLAAKTSASTKTFYETSPAMRALNLSRVTRETHRALAASDCFNPFADARRVVDVVLDATRFSIRNLDSLFVEATGRTAAEDEDADALVAGLNFFRFVLGRARFRAGEKSANGGTEADDARDVASVWSRRAFIEAHVAAPAARWARSTLARLDEGEGASSLAKTEETPNEDDDESRWRVRMGAEHVLEAARFVSELCENPESVTT
jgi:hypothetical protein